MERNNFKEMMLYREEMLPEEVEFQVMRQASTLGHFSDMVSLFVLNTMATVVHLVTGGEDPKCLRDKRDRLHAELSDRPWNRPIVPGEEPFPDNYGNRTWVIMQ